MISIGNASLRAEIDPQRGGSVTRLDALSPGGVAPILRPAAPEFARSGDPTQAAAFVTAPYFGPIGGGRLTLAGATYAILHNHPDEPEPIHGDAWLRPWAVLAQEPETVTLGYTHVPVPGCFPLPYQVTQTLTLGDACLTVGLRLENRSGAAVPMGLAWHPYLPLRPDTVVGAAAGGLWSRQPLDAGPAVVPVPEAFRFDPPRPWQGRVADDTFQDWCGLAEIDQPSLGFRLCLEAGAPFDKLQIFSPEGADFLCVEPTSNAPDAHRIAYAGIAGHGLVTLAPGAALAGDIRLSVIRHG